MSFVADIEEKIGYRFEDPALLRTALTHSSAVEVLQPRTAERLEFLGDAVVGLVLSDLLFERFPSHNEGQLSKYRAALVNTHSFAQKARDLGLDACLTLGKGEEKSGGRQKASILAAAYEAAMGAVFLDGGYVAARSVVLRHFEQHVLTPDGWRQSDAKTELQELCQERYRSAPVYRVAAESGPYHARRFVVDVLLSGSILARGEGRSKRLAEQDAARRALLMCATLRTAPARENT